jgi:hypothetical protein
MPSVRRSYRVRIATAGASEVEGNVAFTLGLDALAEPPVVSGQSVDPVRGTTVSRPFQVPVLDTAAALTALLTAGGRWTALGRLTDVQFRDEGDVNWTTYGTGRISDVSEPDGPGRYRIEISDEGWIGREARIFETADTARLWPAGLKAPWRGFPAGPVADGAKSLILPPPPPVYGIILTSTRPQTRVMDGLIHWIDADAIDLPDPERTDAGNFRTLRLNYAGTSYEIITFGARDRGRDILESLRQLKEAQDEDPGSVHDRLPLYIYAASEPPNTGAAYLETVGAPPTTELPLHVGLDDASHPWGFAGGWFHPVTLTRRIWDELGIRYNASEMDALEADTHFALLAPRVTAPVDDPERWLAEHVWAPAMIAPLRDGAGRRKLVDLRLPQDVDPDTLPVINASNANGHTWQLVGREVVNSIIVRYLHAADPAQRMAIPRRMRVPDLPTRALDGLMYSERDWNPDPPLEGDTVAAIGRHRLTLSMLGALEPTARAERAAHVIRSGRGTVLDGAAREVARDLFDVYQDGPVRGRIDIGRTLAETLEEGALAILDCASLKVPSPETEARSGLRLIRSLAITRHPAHAEIEYIDLGTKLAPLAAPTVGMAMGADNESVNVTISALPAGAVATIEFAYTDSASVPASWSLRRAGVGNETVNFLGAPGEGWAHARAMSTAPGRIRSPWTYQSLALADVPLVFALELSFDDDGAPTLRGEKNTKAVGLRIRWAVHDPEDAPSYGDPVDFAASGLAAGIALDETVEVVPWSGFSGGSVTGTAGPAVAVARGRAGEDDEGAAHLVVKDARWYSTVHDELHNDEHTDLHTDSHCDVAHGDSGGHTDSHQDGLHVDHTDGAHSDHCDAATPEGPHCDDHGDSGAHTDSHTDGQHVDDADPHGDHCDAATPHDDTHDDEHLDHSDALPPPETLSWGFEKLLHVSSEVKSIHVRYRDVSSDPVGASQGYDFDLPPREVTEIIRHRTRTAADPSQLLLFAATSTVRLEVETTPYGSAGGASGSGPKLAEGVRVFSGRLGAPNPTEYDQFTRRMSTGFGLEGFHARLAGTHRYDPDHGGRLVLPVGNSLWAEE